jgi:hypothetical protein
MEPFYIAGSKQTPEVVLDKDKAIFQFKGRSLPENSALFYDPILEWLRQYLNNPNPITILTFELEYFNSASSKIIFEIILMLKELLSKGLDAKVNWCYLEEDEDILESGQTYASLSNVPFVFTTID